VRRMRIGLIAAALAATMTMAACGSSDDEGGGTGASAEGGNDGAKIGLALAGPKNDRGFYQSAYEGLTKAAEEGGYQTSVVDGLEDPQAQLAAMKNLATDNELVIGGSAAFLDSATQLAPQFPDVEFVVITGAVEKGVKNLHAYVPRQGVPAYIAGAVAGSLSKDGHVGFIGGAEIPPTVASDVGFKAGGETESAEKYSATTVGSFSDPARAKTAAKAQIAAGADQIFAFLDAALPGVLQAIEESGKDVGVYNPTAPRCDESDAYVGTAVIRVDLLVERLIADYEAGKLPDGTQFFGVETPEIQRFELCPKYATPETEKIVEDLTKKLNAGEIKLPSEI
jgi:basic membrane protein A and related proteins